MAIDLIRARHPPLEGAMEEDDGEVELTLGLSVGGSSRKAPRAAAAAAQGRAAELKPADVELDLGASGSSPSSSRRGPPFCHADGEGGGGVAAALDQAKRREIHALRRREARRKRDEKKQQQKQRRGICRETSGAAPGPCGVIPPLQMGCSSDDRLSMEARERQVRAKDREARVEEALDSVPNHKLSANHNKNPNADANSNPGLNSIHSNPDLLPFAAQSFPMVAMPYSYPHLQYVPTTNGFGISCMMPCWPPGMSPAAERPSADGNVFQPVAFRAFRPYSLPVVEPGNRESPQSSNAVEPNAGTGTGVERAPSWTASQGSSSSPAASGHRSGSLRGGSSSSGSSTTTSDGRSRGELKFHPPLQQAPSLPMGQSDSSISSSPIIEPDLNAVEEPPPERTPTPNPDGSPSLNKNSPAAGDGGPTGQAPRHRLPRVSATGNGPNGRTVTGVLYRYTKSEVSIVCACHRSSFSPAEFVQHAGGTDVTHPLRHITVVSS